MDHEDEKEPTFEDLKIGKKQFRVMFWITEGGAVNVKADTKEEAEKKLDLYLDYFSKDDALEREFDCTHREWEIMEYETQEA